MSALYFHIPFCKTRCIYCAFYSTTYNNLKDEYVNAMCKELEYKLPETPLEIGTIYFGGGTPSQLSIDHLSRITSHIPDFKSMPDEITIECNPDDITADYADNLHKLGFNRISIGVQTFDDKKLKFLNRRHNAEKVFQSIRILKECGFNNISIDLMYGFPNQTLSQWEDDIDKALSLGIQHISCYCLSYEEDTPLYDMLKSGDFEEIDDETSAAMYYLLKDKLQANGFEHYEISNFALPGYYSKHNSSYWNGTKYIGIGAGAHSYDKHSRSWNICDVKKYIKESNKNDNAKTFCDKIAEYETLSDTDKYNELIMTRLRTAKGLDIDEIPQKYKNYFSKSVEKYLNEGLLIKKSNNIRLSREALFISDSIISSLFKV